MKKSILIFCILATSMFVFSQEEKNTILNFRIAPTFCKVNMNGGLKRDIKMGFRYDLGVTIHKGISSKTAIGSGLVFSRMGYNLTDFAYYVHVVANQITERKIHDHYIRNFIELPLILNLKLSDNQKKSVFVDFEIINQLLISEVRRNDYDSESMKVVSKETIKDLKNRDRKLYNVVPKIGLRFVKKLNENLNLSYGPFYKFGIIKIDDVRDYALGLNLFLGFKL